VPFDRNTSTKVIEKLPKYKDLEIETTRLWGIRTETACAAHCWCAGTYLKGNGPEFRKDPWSQ